MPAWHLCPCESPMSSLRKQGLDIRAFTPVFNGLCSRVLSTCRRERACEGNCQRTAPLRVVPAEAGTHTPCLSDRLRCMGPGSLSAFTRVFDALWAGTTETAIPSHARKRGSAAAYGSRVKPGTTPMCACSSRPWANGEAACMQFSRRAAPHFAGNALRSGPIKFRVDCVRGRPRVRKNRAMGGRSCSTEVASP
jgi:hypothetical protein